MSNPPVTLITSVARVLPLTTVVFAPLISLLPGREEGDPKALQVMPAGTLMIPGPFSKPTTA